MNKLTFLFLVLGFTVNAQPKMQWPHHKKAVIVLTYDDALNSQLDTAIPQLEAAHLRGTFFLTGDLDYQTIPRWRAAAKKGFELGNHTIYHPCIDTSANPVPSAPYTPASIVNEIGIMDNYLFAIDGKTTRTYAYPCTETTVGNGQDYVETLRKSGFIKYARIGGDIDDAVITDFAHLDPLQIPSYGLEGGSTGGQLIAFVKKVEKSGGMGIFMFHGIGGDYITTSAEAHRELLQYLRKNRKYIWVATFQQAMDYVTSELKKDKGNAQKETHR